MVRLPCKTKLQDSCSKERTNEKTSMRNIQRLEVQLGGQTLTWHSLEKKKKKLKLKIQKPEARGRKGSRSFFWLLCIEEGWCLMLCREQQYSRDSVS